MRADAALILALRGERRGFDTLHHILRDRSPRPIGPGRFGGNATLAAQIASDRYYAVHVLAHVQAPRAADIVLPLLRDRRLNEKAAWALGEIGDRRAIPALTAALDDTDARLRAAAAAALERLRDQKR